MAITNSPNTARSSFRSLSSADSTASSNPPKPAVLAELAAKQKQDLAPEPFLLRKAGQSFYNTSPLDMKKLMGDQDHIRENLFSYIQAFAPAVRDIFERFEFYGQIERLAKAGLLYLVTERFAQVDLHPGKVSNSQMGLVVSFR